MVKSTQIARLDGIEAASFQTLNFTKLMRETGLPLAASVDDEQVGLRACELE